VIDPVRLGGLQTVRHPPHTAPSQRIHMILKCYSNAGVRWFVARDTKTGKSYFAYDAKEAILGLMYVLGLVADPQV